MSKSRALVVVLAFALMFTGRGAGGAELQAEPVRLGMSAAFTGPSRGLGIELYRGSMAYFRYLNQSGGLLGRPVHIEARDDGYNPNPAIQNTIDFIREREVLLLFDYVGTPTVTRVLPLLKSFATDNVYLFFPFTGAQPQREAPYDSFVFNLRDSYRHETKGLVDKLVGVGRERIAVYYQADAYGRSGWDGVRRALAAHDLEIVAEATYRRGDSFELDKSEQVRIILEGEPEAVISVGSYEACGAFIREARDAGFDGPIANLSFVGSENMLALLEQAERETGRSYSDNLINTQVVPSYEDTTLPAVHQYRLFMDIFAESPPENVASADYEPFTYSFVSFEGFLNAKVLAEAIERFGRIPERHELPAAMNLLSGYDPGIGASVSFSPENHQGLRKVYFTTVKHGKFVPVNDWGRWAR